MRHLSSVRVTAFILVLITVIVPFGPALAVPVTYDYQFASGALTGGFTASLREGHLLSSAYLGKQEVWR
jgi:hypothetical protein